MTSRLCELTRWMVCFLGSTSTAAAASEACKLLISSCIAKMWGFALTRDFFKSSITCSFVFTRLASFWASLFGSQFFPLNQLPALHSALSVSRKAFRRIHGIEQALSTAFCSQALDHLSMMVHFVLSGSFSFRGALIGNRIFFCRHCSYYIQLNSALWSGCLHIQ